MTNTQIDFKAVHQAAVAALPSLLEQWFPNGKRQGREFVVGSLAGEAGESLKINMDTGKWSDFAAGVTGYDPIDLLAAMRGCDKIDAARELSELLGAGSLPPPRDPPPKQSSKPKWEPAGPAPGEASPQQLRHPAHGEPSRYWTYRDAEGRVLGHVCRFDLADGSKEIIPLSWCSNGRRQAWRWLSFARPRPLYGLDRLAQRPTANVIVVEGEKAADAAQALFPAAVAVTWPGGSGAVGMADFTPLQGRKVVLWPDWDLKRYKENHPQAGQLLPRDEQPGIKAMLRIAAKLDELATPYRFVQPPIDSPDGWDAADLEPPADPVQWLKSRLVDAAELRGPEGADEPPLPDEPPFDPGQYEPVDTEPVEDDHAPFKALGYDHGVFYYLARGGQQVIELSGSAHTKNNLLMLAPLHWWEREYRGGKKEEGFNVAMAANALMRACERAGVYDPSRVRGRGAWWDDGKAVIHLGDRVVIDGEQYDIHRVRSRYVYEAAPPMRAALDNPLSTREAYALVELCQMLQWEKPIDALLLAGWCVVAPVCGALAWRPHIWITGGAGSGKSWTMDNIVRRVLGDTALAVQSETTEAGLRQTLGHDAMPVVFDEAESEDQRAQQRIQNVMALMRQASSEGGAAILKGSATGASKAYRIRSCFAFSSIGVGLQQHADHTRVTVLALTKDHTISNEERAERFARLQEKWLKTLTPEFVERLQARTIRLIPEIRRNAETFAVAGSMVLGNRRSGDQIGALLAGAYALHSSKAISLEEATAWLKQQDWEDTTATQERRDELACLQHLMEYIVKVQGVQKQLDRTLGELVDAAEGGLDDELTRSMAEDALKRYGMRVYGDKLLISNTSSALKKILANTPWATNWGRVLKRIDGAETTDPIRIGPGSTSRATAIPVRLVVQ